MTDNQELQEIRAHEHPIQGREKKKKKKKKKTGEQNLKKTNIRSK